MIILGIESSCDETAVAILSQNKILSHVLHSQIKIHKEFGGVVPEVASRSHLEIIDKLILNALKEAKISINQIDAFAATTGPGLAGGLLVGSLAAKALSYSLKKPFIEINHLQAHALMPTMLFDIKFPFLLLLVSGGHTQFVIVSGINDYEIIGESQDDAVGEAFDKSARLMGMDYPGGKEIEKYAKNGNLQKFDLPKPMFHNNDCNLSFSGLKTAVRNIINKVDLNEEVKADLSASLQSTITDILIKKSNNAIRFFEKKHGKLDSFVLSGGVAANLYLREKLANSLKKQGVSLFYPSVELSTDNGIMIAWAGILKYKQGMFSNLDVPIKPRWSLQDLNK